VRDVDRQRARTSFHSVSIGGRDPLGNLEFLLAVLGQLDLPVPIMLDSDGQHPDSLALVAPSLALTQVTVEFVGPDGMRASAIETLAAADGAGCAHALVLCPNENTTDGVMLRLIEQAHATAPKSEVVIHPFLSGEPPMLDRRWAALLEQAIAVHADTRVVMRIPAPAGLR
jgi:hypothetical protein